MPKIATKGLFKPRKQESGISYHTKQKQAKFNPFEGDEAKKHKTHGYETRMLHD